jgi:phosphoribosylanthranilate isomerase
VTRIKICGITTIDDALAAVEFGADAIGLVFAASRRKVDMETAREIVQRLPPFVGAIGVFVDEHPETVREVALYCGLNGVQLHGNESLLSYDNLDLTTIKAFRVKDESILEIIGRCRLSHFLLDTYTANQAGGTGRAFDWDIARRAGSMGKVILAGGLNTDNIENALDVARPYAVDVSSGVEVSPGRKDRHKLEAFIKKVRLWDNQIH